MLNEKNYTLIDLETTGGSAGLNRVIEIGILRVEKGEVVSKYNQLINPEVPIPEIITKITGLRDKDVSNAPTFTKVAEEVLNFFGDAVFVAHNALFDYSFLREEYRRIDHQFDIDRLCTVRLSRNLYPDFKHHNLAALIERHNFDAGNRHRAFDDANVLLQFFRKINLEFEPEVLRTSLEKSTTKFKRHI